MRHLVGLIPPVSLIVLGACSSAVGNAESRYAMVEKQGTYPEVCAEGKQLLDQYLEAHDEQKYADFKGMNGSICYLAETDHYRFKRYSDLE